MKKVLEGELLSLAHRVLQMKDKEDVSKLYNEAKEIYEKLLILKFYYDNRSQVEKTLSIEELHKQLEARPEAERNQIPSELIEEEHPLVPGIKEEEQTVQEELLSDASKIETPIETPEIERKEIAYETQFIDTVFDDSIEESEEDVQIHQYLDQHEAMLRDKEVVQNTENEAETEETPKSGVEAEKETDHFFGFDFTEVDFVRVENVPVEEEKKFDMEFESKDTDESMRIEKETELPIRDLFEQEVAVQKTEKKKSLNDIYNSTITVGLNDRIAFEKNLFNGSSEDFNRVLSQLNTVNSWEEAVSFVEDLVKPDYDNWKGKEEYEARFMELVEKRFI